ncbi:MAG: FCD domain-containing protein [Rhodomicrobium sp.]
MTAKTQSDRMFDRLQADILACRVTPGSKLRINEIADSSDVSLGAVREALARLSAEGLVISESQKGYRVAPLFADDLCDLTEARVEIERIALSRSIARGDLEWETSLVAAWHRLSKIPLPQQPEDPGVQRWAAAHSEFHQALVAACGSTKLLQIRSQLYQQSERYRRYSGIVDRQRNVFAEHQAIFDAAIERHAAAAAEAIEEHLRMTAKIIVSSFVRQAEDGDRHREAV